jgi:hypothetical protein
MTYAALVIGVLIMLQGLLGLASPGLFTDIIGMFQVPPVIYFAAVIRVVFGVVLVLAAPVSRAPIALRGLGALIVVGGLLTPVFGAQFATIILGWWSEGGADVVRMWASAALVIGAFIAYATAPRRRAA